MRGIGDIQVVTSPCRRDILDGGYRYGGDPPVGLSREEIMGLVERILENDQNGVESEEEMARLERGVLCPYVTGLIYHPNRYVEGREELSPEEIAEIAMRYEPIAL
ncbi:hypothetical protein SAMN02745673_02600 [Marinactinospora thermotolerans DSM 45154]|uniref:Colicin immunity protein / pyocin immunity protein n=1 Tax=Marinactinospora thermotolerans DSM 45154 TaxID=1122192 RepID=A0A1T4R887_9ACTN|nr:hypothetical protein [Marinactinospora thermotolerans]SKA12127.1 hypothetical protein SAMN02745673_02600 [Marinactinospora thermotolerans DSM 45154]